MWIGMPLCHLVNIATRTKGTFGALQDQDPYLPVGSNLLQHPHVVLAQCLGHGIAGGRMLMREDGDTFLNMQAGDFKVGRHQGSLGVY